MSWVKGDEFGWNVDQSYQVLEQGGAGEEENDDETQEDWVEEAQRSEEDTWEDGAEELGSDDEQASHHSLNHQRNDFAKREKEQESMGQPIERRRSYQYQDGIHLLDDHLSNGRANATSPISTSAPNPLGAVERRTSHTPSSQLIMSIDPSVLAGGKGPSVDVPGSARSQ